MIPVRTRECNCTYSTGHPAVGDLPCAQVEGMKVTTIWEPDEAELEALKNGGRIVLSVWSDPPPVIALGVGLAEDTEPVGPYRFKTIPELDDEERS